MFRFANSTLTMMINLLLLDRNDVMIFQMLNLSERQTSFNRLLVAKHRFSKDGTLRYINEQETQTHSQQ